MTITPGGGSIRIAARRAAVDGHGHPEAVAISVSDTGAGIPAAFRSRIFDKFFRLEHHHAAPRLRTRGAGIGLYMCRQIVELHAGQIACTSSLDGRGTTITIALPVIGSLVTSAAHQRTTVQPTSPV